MMLTGILSVTSLIILIFAFGLFWLNVFEKRYKKATMYMLWFIFMVFFMYAI